MRRGIAISLLSVLVLAGCNDQPEQTDVAPQACVDAMRKQFADAVNSGATGSRPAECDGVSDKGLEDAAAEILGDALDG